MQSSLLNSSTAKEYLKTRAIDWQAIKGLPVGYNAFKNSKFNYLRGCVTFGLLDKNGKVVSMYGRSIRDNDKAKHYYTPNRQGLYPSYPSSSTRKLILTESVIDAATLLSLKEDLEAEVLVLYGTNGLTPEHVHAIQQLPELEEIILFFDGDQAGKQANEKHGQFLQELLPNVIISTVTTLEDEDINSIAQGHEPEIFIQLLKDKKTFLFSSEEKLAPMVQELEVNQKSSTEEKNLILTTYALIQATRTTSVTLPKPPITISKEVSVKI
ncbi:MAG: toprim domain-containing protein [Flavobacteriales bacterium]|nr:toprim domain-containing protein [Flavobacteriales bacterium]